MTTIKLDKRQEGLRGRQLRRQGIIPAILYGKHLEDSISVQLSELVANKLLRSRFIGSKIDLEIDGEPYQAILKEVTYIPATTRIEHISFQALSATEKVRSVAQVLLSGRDSVTEGVVMQLMNEIPYSALPADMVETVEISVAGMTAGDIVLVGDLDISKNEKVEVLVPDDTPVITITVPRTIEDEEEAAEAEEAAVGEDVADVASEEVSEEASEE